MRWGPQHGLGFFLTVPWLMWPVGAGRRKGRGKGAPAKRGPQHSLELLLTVSWPGGGLEPTTWTGCFCSCRETEGGLQGLSGDCSLHRVSDTSPRLPPCPKMSGSGTQSGCGGPDRPPSAVPQAMILGRPRGSPNTSASSRGSGSAEAQAEPHLSDHGATASPLRRIPEAWPQPPEPQPFRRTQWKQELQKALARGRLRFPRHGSQQAPPGIFVPGRLRSPRDGSQQAPPGTFFPGRLRFPRDGSQQVPPSTFVPGRLWSPWHGSQQAPPGTFVPGVFQCGPFTSTRGACWPAQPWTCPGPGI